MEPFTAGETSSAQRRAASSLAGIGRVWLLLLLAACSQAVPSPKTTQVALDTMTDEQRRNTLQSTASALDSRPEYVDELFQIVRRHPRAFDRFLENTARDLRDPALAQPTAAHILREPESFKQLLLVTLDQLKDNPQGAEVLTTVMVERRVLMADLLTDRPAKLTAITVANMRAGAEKPAARAALRSAMRDAQDPVARVIVEDPATVGVLMKAMLDAGVARSVLERSLAELTR